MNNRQDPPLTPAEVHAARPADVAPVLHPMEISISYVLRGGVLVAGAIIAAGLALLLYQGAAPGEPATMGALRAQVGRQISLSPAGILAAATHLRASGIIEVGLLALILTPIARVAMTAVLFLLQRDRIFTAVTCVVLFILILGLLGVGS